MDTGKILTFLHSGDAGDIIASLATVKEICERENAKALLLLDTSGGTTCNDDELNLIVLAQSRNNGLRFNDKMFDFIEPLISVQPYIAKVEKWSPDIQLTIDYNLNEFRRKFVDRNIAKETNQNLVFLHQVAFELDIGYKGPWLSCNIEEHCNKHKILIARTSRYGSAHGFFVANERLFKESAEFIGTDFEYELFNNAFEYVPKRLLINNALEGAEAIATSETFICNATVFYWVAVGLGITNLIHEFPIDIATTYFPNGNPNTIHYLQGMHFLK